MSPCLSSCMWNRITRQLLEGNNLSSKKANSEKLGLGIDNPYRRLFLSLRVNEWFLTIDHWHIWYPVVISYAKIPRCRLNSTIFSPWSHLSSVGGTWESSVQNRNSREHERHGQVCHAKKGKKFHSNGRSLQRYKLKAPKQSH